MALNYREPLVSVILPTHNRPEMLDEAVQSVRNQTYKRWELIVIDDASDPPVGDHFCRGSDERVRVLRNDTSCGGAEAKARATSYANGEYICFLDDDDKFSEDYICQAVSALDQNSDIHVLFMGVHWFGASAEHYEPAHRETRERLLAGVKWQRREPHLLVLGDGLVRELLLGMSMDFQRPFVRRAALDKIGYHRAGVSCWGDCEWAIRAALVAQCAILEGQFYMQRVDGQGYHSAPDKEFKQLRSGSDLVFRLYEERPVGISLENERALREGAGRYLDQFAYALSRQGLYAEALAVWIRSLRLSLSLQKSLFPVKLLVRAISAEVRSP